MSIETTSESAPAGFALKGQYVKDLSFENPLAPQSLFGNNEKPTIEVSVDIKVQKLQDDVHEMTLHLASRATAEQKTMFLVDLAYAGVFQLTNIPADRIEQVILVDCAFVLFPFARRIIADVTRDGGFPPLMLDPIDFHSLFMQARAQAESAA
ncbi:MAG: protein-export chaperone SecB [Alphaproteobacteria bacterium]|nr:protein-export chaperone SecB [Alphaproteobacteria bacterium]